MCVFQVCARPQYGKWISCVTTDSDWMVRKRFTRIAVTPPPPSIKVHFDESDVIFDL